jgi:hypothetical protein
MSFIIFCAIYDDDFLLLSHLLLGLVLVQRTLIIHLLILHSSEVTGAVCYNQFHNTGSYLSS